MRQSVRKLGYKVTHLHTQNQKNKCVNEDKKSMVFIYKKAQFMISAANTKQLPPDLGYEVAIVGRSNAGKSSVLNVLTQNKQLARVSKTPGRTQLINVFSLDSKRRLIDLPGYGYAKVAI